MLELTELSIFYSYRLNLGILDRCRDTSRTILTLDHYFNFVASIEIGHFQLTIYVGLQSELLSRQGICLLYTSDAADE